MFGKKQKPFRERRRYERVNDSIIMIWRRVAANEVPAELDTQDKFLFFEPIESQINLLGLEASYLLNVLKEGSPVLGEYLEILERRLDILSSAFRIKDEASAFTPVSVNLSASGMAFVSDVELSKDNLLEIKILLPPTLHSVLTYGRVVDVLPNGDFSGFSIAVDFIRISELDREHLDHHVARRKAILQFVQ